MLCITMSLERRKDQSLTDLGKWLKINCTRSQQVLPQNKGRQKGLRHRRFFIEAPFLIIDLIFASKAMVEVALDNRTAGRTGLCMTQTFWIRSPHFADISKFLADLRVGRSDDIRSRDCLLINRKKIAPRLFSTGVYIIQGVYAFYSEHSRRVRPFHFLLTLKGTDEKGP